MIRTRLGLGTLMVAASLLCSCSQLNLNAIAPLLASNTSVTTAASGTISQLGRSIHLSQIRVEFYNRLSNNELVPLVPDKLESLRYNGQFSLDAGSFPRNQGLVQTFPFIESGDHLIELSFQNQAKPVEIPIVVPDNASAETVILVVLSFDASGEMVRDVQVGYDMNGDHQIDKSANIYRSSNGQSYLIYSPDGRVQEWISPLDKTSTDQVPTNTTAALPPGSNTSKSSAEPPPKSTNTSLDKPATPPVPKIPTPKPLPLPEPPAAFTSP